MKLGWVIYAEITAAGLELFDRILPTHAASLHRLMGGLLTEEKHMAIELLKKLGKGALN